MQSCLHASVRSRLAPKRTSPPSDEPLVANEPWMFLGEIHAEQFRRGKHVSRREVAIHPAQTIQNRNFQPSTQVAYAWVKAIADLPCLHSNVRSRRREQHRREQTTAAGKRRTEGGSYIPAKTTLATMETHYNHSNSNNDSKIVREVQESVELGSFAMLRRRHHRKKRRNDANGTRLGRSFEMSCTKNILAALGQGRKSEGQRRYGHQGDFVRR